MKMRKKLVVEERPIRNAVAVFRERGNYLQRMEQFEKAIQTYNEALRWNNTDILSLLGRSSARVKSTHYAEALVDAAKATELEPENMKAAQIRAQTEYEKGAFERALVLAHRGVQNTRFPPDFADCVKRSEETVRECTGKAARKMLELSLTIPQIKKIRKDSRDVAAIHQSRMEPIGDLKEQMSVTQKMRAKQISRLMSSKYLERMAHDKYFLTALCKDERLTSANKKGSRQLQELADKALADVRKRQVVLRERRPLYAERATEVAAQGRLSQTHKEQILHTQKRYAKDATRLLKMAQAMYEERDTARCLEQAEFAMEQITRKPATLLPGKDIFLEKLHDIVANAFLDQNRFREDMSYCDRERRAYILLGMSVSREPSRDSVLRVRPPAPRSDARRRIRSLERALTMSVRATERCYILHKLARLYLDTKQGTRARFFAYKCQTEARAANQLVWLLNAAFLLARCHLLQNNRPEARAVLIEATGLARGYGFDEVAVFFDTCVSLALEGDVGNEEAPLEKREKEMVNLMQDEDLRFQAEHLFKRMSVMPAQRRFSILPHAHVENTMSMPQTVANRRMSILPRTQQPTKSPVLGTSHVPFGLQDFDI